MLKNEINEILNIHNDEYGIANVIDLPPGLDTKLS